MRILLVENDLDLANAITQLLTGKGYAIDHAPTYKEGAALVSDNHYDLLIFEHDLPDGTGIDLCASIRIDGVDTPVLILTAEGVEGSRTEGPNAFVDLYVTTPLDDEEFLERVRMLVSRNESQSEGPLQIADLIIDRENETVTSNRTPIPFSAKEFSLLVYMALNRGRVLTHAMISKHAWNAHYQPRSQAIDVYMSVLQKKLGLISGTTLIHSMKGLGYKLDDSK